MPDLAAGPPHAADSDVVAPHVPRGQAQSSRRGSENEGSFVDRYSPRLVILLLISSRSRCSTPCSPSSTCARGAGAESHRAVDAGSRGRAVRAAEGGLTAVCVLFVMLHKNSATAGRARDRVLFYFALIIYHIVLQIDA